MDTKEQRKGYSFGPEARDTLDDDAPQSQVTVPLLMALVHELNLGPAVLLMLRAQFHLQGGLCLQGT